MCAAASTSVASSLPAPSSSSQLPAPRRPDLQSLPVEILDNIAHFTALTSPTAHLSTVPPHALANLVVACKHLYRHLGINNNPRLYARIFSAKFDVNPIARRYGRKAVTVSNLAAELKKRCVILKRIKKAGEIGLLRPEGLTELGDSVLKENLWLAYLMMTENDGHNFSALLWADIRTYLSLHHTQEMLRSALLPGYPPESEDRALAMHLSYLLSDANLLAKESKEDAEEKLFILRPYVFASHKFEGFYAPWTLRQLPIEASDSPIPSRHARAQTLLSSQHESSPIPITHPSNGHSHASQMTAEGDGNQSAPQTNPFLADHTPRCRSTVIQHVGQTLVIRPPCIVHAAYHLFFGQIERDPAIVGLTAITRRGAPPGVEPVNRDTAGENDPANDSASGRTTQLGQLHPTLGGGVNGTPFESPPPRNQISNPHRLTSVDHDNDVVRLLSCYSPLTAPGLKPCFFAGIVAGAWEGRFSFFDFDSYREMLGGRMRSLYEGPFGEQPQVWKLQEHFLRVDEGPSNSRRPSTAGTGGSTGNGDSSSSSGGLNAKIKREGGTGSMVNAGFLTEEPFEETMALPTSLKELRERERELGGGSAKRRGANLPGGRSGRREPPGPPNPNVDRGRDSGSLSPRTSKVAVVDCEDGTSSDKVKSTPTPVDGHVVPPQDLDLFPQFSAEDGGAAAGYGYLPSSRPASTGTGSKADGDDDEDEDEDDDGDGNGRGRYEMLVSGSGHSAWGSFVLRGRIRAWDGMLILSKEYRPDGRGRWLYRGYVTAGGCLVGRWRDSFTPGGMSGYEGPFVLNRRCGGDLAGDADDE